MGEPHFSSQQLFQHFVCSPASDQFRFLAAEPMAGHTRWKGALERRWGEELCRGQCGAGRAGTGYQTMPAQVLCRLVITELCVQKDSAFSPINAVTLLTYVDKCQRVQSHSH